METEIGKIVTINDENAVVQMEAGSQCQHCGAKHACSAMGDVMRQIEIPAKNDVHVGDHVTISYQSQSRIVSVLLVFLLPVLFLIAGYFIGFALFGTEGKGILTSLGGLVIAFILNWGLNKIFAKDSHFLPTIVKIDK
jgi:positive regulator of sigma E activity